MNYTAIIIDDEIMGAERLQILIEKHCSEISILSVCLKPEIAIEIIKKKKPNIIFLDIEMPNISGFNLLEQVRAEKFQCIFTTAYNQYAIDAIRQNALDYLLKPIDVNDLKSAIEKAKEKIDNDRDSLSQATTKLIDYMTKKKNSTFSIPVGGEVYFVDADEVQYFEADGNYTHIYMDDIKKNKITSSKNLKKIEESINLDNFIRIHNSYIINVKNVIKYNKGLAKTVIMKNGKQLNVSKVKSNELIEKLDMFFPKLFN